jgi:hypothetical protein
MQPNKANIWNYAQNKPTLIVRDLEAHGVSKMVTYTILLTRGVFKWFSCRRDLIRAKDRWKVEINRVLSCIKNAKEFRDMERLWWLRGYLKALELCRKDVREICHSDRWRAPDNDDKAFRFLTQLEGGLSQ